MTSPLRRLLLRGARIGLIAGTLYFLVIGVLTMFGGVLTQQSTSVLWLVLFVGSGAGCGLVLGVWAAAVVHGGRVVLLRRAAATGSSVSDVQERVWSGAAAAIAVGLVASVSMVTGIPGLLAPDITTVVVIPMIIAAFAAATTDQPKRPET